MNNGIDFFIKHTNKSDEPISSQVLIQKVRHFPHAALMITNILGESPSVPMAFFNNLQDGKFSLGE